MKQSHPSTLEWMYLKTGQLLLNAKYLKIFKHLKYLAKWLENVFYKYDRKNILFRFLSYNAKFKKNIQWNIAESNPTLISVR